MRIVLFILLLFKITIATAQTKVSAVELNCKLYSNAQYYMQNNNLDAGIKVLNDLILLEPENVIFRRDLATAYLAKQKYRSAQMVIDDCLKLKDATEECFVLGATTYSKLDNYKLANKVLQKGLSKYTTSALILNAKGELNYNFNKMADAEAAWVSAININPSYPILFYNLANYYAEEKNPYRASICAETFLNMESFTSRTVAMKKVFVEANLEIIKQLFEKPNETEQITGIVLKFNSEFEKYYYSKLQENKSLILNGFNIDDAAAWRAQVLREINVEKKYGFSLFNHLSKIRDNGYWLSYHQWLFGSSLENNKFTTWVKNNSANFDNFLKFMQEEKVKPEQEQFYFN